LFFPNPRKAGEGIATTLKAKPFAANLREWARIKSGEEMKVSFPFVFFGTLNWFYLVHTFKNKATPLSNLGFIRANLRDSRQRFKAKPFGREFTRMGANKIGGRDENLSPYVFSAP
jgi:hypothetical protein